MKRCPRKKSPYIFNFEKYKEIFVDSKPNIVLGSEKLKAKKVEPEVIIQNKGGIKLKKSTNIEMLRHSSVASMKDENAYFFQPEPRLNASQVVTPFIKA